MLSTDPMMLERFGDHLLQHLRTQKTYFSYLHWGTVKCWCSAVQTARCQPVSEKCLLAHVLFLYFKGNCQRVRCRGGGISHRLACCYKRAASWLEDILKLEICLQLWCHDCSEETVSLLKYFVSMCLMRGREAALPLCPKSRSICISEQDQLLVPVLGSVR